MCSVKKKVFWKVWPIANREKIAAAGLPTTDRAKGLPNAGREGCRLQSRDGLSANGGSHEVVATAARKNVCGPRSEPCYEAVRDFALP
jgi:hypothetical protein